MTPSTAIGGGEEFTASTVPMLHLPPGPPTLCSVPPPPPPLPCFSDKMDVQDHYTAWRQTHDMPASKRQGLDGPFSFCRLGGRRVAIRMGDACMYPQPCAAPPPISTQLPCLFPPPSYPFLLDPRAKSNLLHIEARFQMEQV